MKWNTCINENGGRWWVSSDKMGVKDQFTENLEKHAYGHLLSAERVGIRLMRTTFR